MMSTTPGRSSTKFPFTANQWQELEHQALIYKYMVAGIPIPPDLLFTIKRNLDSSLTSKFFPYQTSQIGWNPYQMGYGGKKIDPEPGRCRRTDGKKWRCSKEAYPDSKYCERHMHRGKNRSRKPVEVMATATATASATGPNQTPVVMPTNHHHHHHHHPSSIISSSLSMTKLQNPSSDSPSSYQQQQQQQQVGSSDTSFPYGRSHHYDPHFLYPNSSSSRPPGSVDLSSQELFDSAGSFSRDRYLHGVKDDLATSEHEHAFFTESSGTTRLDESWQQQQQQQSHGLRMQSGYPYLELKTDISKQDQQKQMQMWGRGEFGSSELPSSMEVKREGNEPRKTIHHFFDEWPPKGSRDSSPWQDSSSTTQLSISMPTSSSQHDFFLSTSSRPHNDG